MRNILIDYFELTPAQLALDQLLDLQLEAYQIDTNVDEANRSIREAYRAKAIERANQHLLNVLRFAPPPVEG